MPVGLSEPRAGTRTARRPHPAARPPIISLLHFRETWILERATEVREHERFMREALAEAARAAEKGEVPVGCVVVAGGEIIARAHNLRESERNPVAHAEVLALEEAARRRGSWRLEDCTLYVTLEPCPMCAGAAVNARLAGLVYGAADPKAGACGSVLDVARCRGLNHRVEVVGGVLPDECGDVLSSFFAERRA